MLEIWLDCSWASVKLSIMEAISTRVLLPALFGEVIAFGGVNALFDPLLPAGCPCGVGGLLIFVALLLPLPLGSPLFFVLLLFELWPFGEPEPEEFWLLLPLPLLLPLEFEPFLLLDLLSFFVGGGGGGGVSGTDSSLLESSFAFSSLPLPRFLPCRRHG